MKTGISGVSAKSAGNNLKAELPGWDFEQVRRSAREKWNKQLSRIHITTDNEAHRRVFYAALYHASLGPVLFDDADGSYRGMDKQNHKLSPGQRNYTTFSLWDTFRAAHPLYTLIVPERLPDFGNALIRMAEQSPAGMPVWPLQGTETGTMTGYHSAAVLAEACNKGITGIDYERAYKVMMKRAMVDDYRGLGYYRQDALHPLRSRRGVRQQGLRILLRRLVHRARRQEARPHGRREDAGRALAQLSQLLRPQDQLRPAQTGQRRMGSRLRSAREWAHRRSGATSPSPTPGRPPSASSTTPPVSSKSWAATKTFLAKLDELFDQPSTLPADAPPDIAGLVGQYAQGNEPSHHIAYLYAYAGEPHKIQQRVRMLMDTMYKPLPDGLQGNEDVGQMSAWYIMSAMGFYPVDPVSGNYIFGTPLFDNVTLQLGKGKQLEIVAHRSAPSDQYIQSVTFNGKPHTRSWFNHREIVNGAKIVFELGSQPNLEFGTQPADIPPSLKLEIA